MLLTLAQHTVKSRAGFVPQALRALHKTKTYKNRPWALNNFKVILYGHFDENLSGIIPKMGVGWAVVRMKGGSCRFLKVVASKSKLLVIQVQRDFFFK